MTHEERAALIDLVEAQNEELEDQAGWFLWRQIADLDWTEAVAALVDRSQGR